MAEYLDKFNGLIGKRQADQIIKLLNRKKNAGQIRTVDEFTQRLEGLIRELTSTILQPTLQVFPVGPGETISSEKHNYMLDRVEDDLSAAFEEANKIDEVQKAHEAIVRDVILKNLRAGVAELESKISLYETLGSNTYGFGSSVFTTFRESRLERTPRKKENQTLFLDPRSKETIDSSYDAYIDLTGERLLLATESQETYSISAIRQIFDADTPQSEAIFESPTLKLQNVIDRIKGTYWIQSVYFTNTQKSINIKLELDLGIKREINWIQIEPVLKQGLYLESIYFLDSDGITKILSEPDIYFEGSIGVQTRKILTRKITLVFRNENGRLESLQHLQNDTLFNQLMRVEDKLPSRNEGMMKLSGISDNLSDIISSKKGKDLAKISKEEAQVYTGYAFTTGFDNINIGLARYRDTGVYVSTPLRLEGKSNLGLKTLESRPVISSLSGEIEYTSTTYDGDDDDIYLGSIEYWIVKRDYNADGILVRTIRFSILPLATTRIHHERLFLTEKSTTSAAINDVGQTMFYTVCDYGGEGDGDVIVYRNGIEIDNLDGNVTSTIGWRQASPITTTALKTPNNNNPMTFKIQIVGASESDIFTVSYTPMASSTSVRPDPPYGAFTSVGGLQVVDLTGDLSIRRNENHVIVMEEDQENDIVSYSECYLLIILRRNSAYLNLSPAVEEYTLMGGSKKIGKFEE